MRPAPLALALWLAGCASGPPAVPTRCSHGVADLHVDLPFQVHYRGRSRDLSQPGGDVTAASLRAGCVELVVLSLFLPMGLRPRPLTVEELAAVLNTAEMVVAANPVLTGTDGPGTRVLFSLEGSQAIAVQPDQIPHLVSRGVILFGLVHAHHNDLADSSSDPHPKRGGLTPAGERFVEAVYRAGALVDLSHASDDSFTDVAVIARRWGRPLVATHSNARAIALHHRNLTDDQLKTIAASGGIVGLAFHAPFLRHDRGRATVDDVARHARHMIDVMGPSHVAIGSDLDGLIQHAAGLETHHGMPTLIEAFQRQGILAQTLQALLRANAKRVLLPLVE
ncbi:MAG: membrane dipeptidase [Deltaproteobacteria bacterium]|nr:membrane dipeptidase [Deltaproteobacteria bacterium]